MLNVIQSGSKGNCYVIGDDELLILECGVPYNKMLKAIDFKRSNIVGCLLTHEHGDHAKYIKQFASAGIDIYSAKETFTEDNFYYNNVMHNSVYILGSYKFIPFRTLHDANNSFGYFINHPIYGKIVFVTDCKKVYTRFDTPNYIIIEANYSDSIIERNLNKSAVDKWRLDRIRNSHMSIDDCIEFLSNNDLSCCNKIFLIHLSDSNSDERLFCKLIEDKFGIKTISVKNNTKYELLD